MGSFGTSGQVAINKTLGVFYSNSDNAWCIYIEDQTDMPVGLAFDIIVANQDVLAQEDDIIATNISLYPNPTTNFINVTSVEPINTIKIYDILGREVLQVKGEGSNMQIDVSAINSGNYFIKIEVTDIIKTLKFMKQ